MPKVTMFILENCPYCIRARKINEKLLKEDRFKDITIELVDERKEAALADSFDYYNVPCYYLGREKLHEGAADEADICSALERALGK